MANRGTSLYMTRFQNVKNAAMALDCLFPNLDSTPLSTLETLGKAVYFSVPQFPHCIMMTTTVSTSLCRWEDWDGTRLWTSRRF